MGFEWREGFTRLNFNYVSNACDLLIDPHAAAEEVEAMAFSIARDEYPGLRFGLHQQKLNQMAEAIRPQLTANMSLDETVARLCTIVYQQLGFHGCEDYDDPRGQFINDVIDRRTGGPVLLAVVLIALGRRLDFPIDPIAFPGHFLVRMGGDDGVYVDPFDGGHPLPRLALEGLALEALSCNRREAHSRLEPVGERTVGVRILLNLQRIYRQRRDHARSLVVSDRLFDLTGAPMHRCDRGLHALALGARHSAIDDLEAYLAAHPTAHDADKVRTVLSRARDLDAHLH